MPLWKIYHPPTTFSTPASKSAFAAAITKIYTTIPLPAFYVNVLFIPVAADSYYIGGESRPGPENSKPFVRVTIENIARKMPDQTVANRFLARVDEALKPHIADQGYDWEYSVLETSRDLWKINGLVPPMPGSEAEIEWGAKNEAGPYEAEKGGFGTGKL